MSVYQRVHTPNSPLMPLTPMWPNSPSPSMFLSPYATSMRSRRSFTPSHLNMLPPPSLSPIECAARPAVTYVDKCTGTTPDHPLDCSLILSSSKKSMKKARSVRKQSVRENRSSTHLTLTPIRRSLFAEKSPVVRIITPRSSNEGATPQLKVRIHTPTGGEQEIPERLTPSIFEQTFTVMSILKEIHMQKYALLFTQEEVDLYVFLMLTHHDMAELGIEEADRPILMKAIQCYNDFFGNGEKK